MLQMLQNSRFKIRMSCKTCSRDWEWAVINDQ